MEEKLHKIGGNVYPSGCVGQEIELGVYDCSSQYGPTVTFFVCVVGEMIKFFVKSLVLDHIL